MKRDIITTHRWLNMAGIALCIALAAMLTWARPAKDTSATADAAIADRHAEIKALRAAIDMCGGPDVVAEEVSKGVYQCLKEQKVTP